MFESELIESNSVSDPVLILDALGLRWRTGKLHVLALRDTFGVYIDRGQVLLATSSERQLRLGQVLVRQGSASLLALERLVRDGNQGEWRPSIGTLLLQNGLVSRAELGAGLEAQAIEVLARILDSSDSTILSLGDEPPPPGIEIIPFSADYLMKAAEKRHAERAATRAMARLLPPRRTEMRVAAALPSIANMLSDAELLIALAIQNGATTLERILDQSPADPLVVRRAVLTLIERGVVIVEGREHTMP